MTTSTTESEQRAQVATEKPEAPKKAHVAARTLHVAPSKGKSGEKPSLARKATKGDKGSRAATGTRHGSKTEKVLDLLKRPAGATTNELIKATGWQLHSVRGFLSGTVGKKMGLAVTATKGEDGKRSYFVKG